MKKLDPIDAASHPQTEDADPDDPKGGNLYPATEDEHRKLLGWCLDEFNAADAARLPLTTRWRRFYKLYRNYVQRKQGDWRSKVFIPYVFYVIEAIVPRMVAQLPKFVVDPIGPEDEEPAKVMEKMLEWSAKRSDLYVELVKVYRSALKYGTGIVKVRHERKVQNVRTFVDETEQMMMPSSTPMMDPDTGQPMMDLNGQPMMDTSQEVPFGPPQPTGRRIPQDEERVIYDGPKAEFVDIFNFWPSPESTCIEDARYVIQRVFRDDKYVEKMIDDGIYRLPPGHTYGDLWSGQEDDHLKLMSETNVQATNPSRKQAEIWEIWTDDTVIVVLNRCAVVRVDENPFDHGRKPFARVVDYFQEGEFWGIGEIEPIEGMQELTNALWNQRVDNVRMVMNRMFVFDPDNLHDKRDLQQRPGGAIRIRNKELPVSAVIQALDMPDVTSSAYEEVAEVERMTEKISGVSGYTTGTDSASMNDTATGVSIITEQGNTRFSLKVRMAEMTALGVIAEMYGSILQQFMPEELTMKVVNQDGSLQWQSVTQESLQGGFDFDIEAESSTVTESVRKEQAMNLMQTFAQIVDPTTGQPVLNLQALAEDVLDAFQKKNKARYAPAPPPPPPQMQDPNAMGGATGDPNMDPNALMDALAAQGQGPQQGPPQPQQLQAVNG